VLMNVN